MCLFKINYLEEKIGVFAWFKHCFTGFFNITVSKNYKMNSKLLNKIKPFSSFAVITVIMKTCDYSEVIEEMFWQMAFRITQKQTFTEF